VAVTGATGFVGYHAATELRRQGAEVVALVRPTSDWQRLLAAGIVCKIATLDEVVGLADNLTGCDHVVHAAGAVGFGNEWQAFYRVNVQGTCNILEAARRAGVRRVIHTSSIVAVGASETPTSLDENSSWNLRASGVPYVTTKRWSEEVALGTNGKGLEVVVVNPASIVGPDDFSGSEFGILCQRFWKGRIPFHFGGGNNFVDVRDVARGLVLAAERGRPGERYLLAGENRTYQSFFSDLCRIARKSMPRFRLPNTLAGLLGRLHDRFRRKVSKRPYFTSAQAALMGYYFFFDSGKAQRELGYVPRPLARSLADAYAFWMPAPRSRFWLPNWA